MIIIEIIGGLGNQMFQYALGRYLSEKNNVDFKLDITGFENYSLRNYELGIFNIKESFASPEEIEEIKYKKQNIIIKMLRRKKEKKLSKNYIQEKHFHFDPEILGIKDNVYLSGYWQSEKYFMEIADILKKEFSIKSEPNAKNREFLEKIKNTNSVSLHIRRGDYVSDAQTKSVHCVNFDEYYVNAVNLMKEKLENPHFFIFSDEPEWVKNNFAQDMEFIIVDCNSSDTGYEDMRLMSNCRHNITANSSFSWWGAWLNNNPDKIVITPQKWFNISERNIKDLLPESWIKL